MNIITPPKIAVLGPRQSGKTCLAIGLSAVNSKELVVQPGGTGNEDDNFLADLRVGLCSDKNRPGRWPDATNKGDIRQFGLTIRKGHKEAKVSFIDYAGENVQGEAFAGFANQYLARLDGAIVLVNPGADAFSGDARKREAVLLDYQVILEYLRNLPTHPFVALTVTAYDRLDGDLKDRKDEVESFVEKLENILRNSGQRSKTLLWTRMNVTITGHLDNQDVPRLAEAEENTSWEPFDWLLEKTIWAARRAAAFRALRKVGIAAAVAAAIAGAWCYVDASKDKSEILNAKQKCIALLNDFRAERDSKKGCLDDAIKTNKYLYDNEWSWYQSFAKLTAKNLDSEKLWKAVEDRLNYLKRNVEKDGYLGDVGDLLRDYTPLTEATKRSKEQWKTSWEEEKFRLIEKINQNIILTPIDILLSELDGEHGEHVWTSLVTNYISLAKLQLDGAPEEFIAKCDSTKSTLDDRIAEEGKWLVRAFEQAASVKASLMATRSFAEKLAGWTSVSTNGVAARDDLLSSVSNSIPAWRSTYEIAGISNRVVTLMCAVRGHDRGALARLYPLYAGFDAVDTAETDSTLAAFLDGARKDLDNRIADDWRKSILPDFEKAAATEATAGAVQELARLMEDWQPSTTNGGIVKAELLTSIQTETPRWRGAYEKAQYDKKMQNAKDLESLAELAALSPNRYPANEFLAKETISMQWEKTGRPAFEKARNAFVSEIVEKAVGSARKNRPALSDRERELVHKKVRDVGVPLDEASLIADIAKGIEKRVETWDSEKRDECKKWVNEHINSTTADRSRIGGGGLFTIYERAARGRMGEENPFFDEIVATAVYREVEKWFESDVGFFEKEFQHGKSIWDDDDNRAVRWVNLESKFQEFRKTCEKVESAGTPPIPTWAYRFAQLCMDKNNGNVDAGSISKAFPQTLTITQLDGLIDYGGKFPTAYKRTAFAAEFRVADCKSDGSLDDKNLRKEILIERDHDDAPNHSSNSLESENTWKSVWNAEKTVLVGLFQRCEFVVKATDYNKGTGFPRTGTPIRTIIPLYDANLLPVTYNGSFSFTRFRHYKVDVSVNIKGRKSGATPSSLLDQAKRESGGR